MNFIKATLLLSILTVVNLQLAVADTVHLGLKINYETAMSHVEKRDLPVVEMLKRISLVLPETRFLISGHTDIVGSYNMNVELSKGRATTVKLLMVYNGVPADRIETKWFSFDAPIASNETEEGRAKNRRTVATVYGLTRNQALKLARAAEKSKRFYVIDIESEKVTDYVAEVLEPKLDVPAEPEVIVEEDVVVDAELEAEEEDLIETPPAVEEPKPVKIRKPSDRHRYFVGWALTDNELVATRTGFEAIWVTDFNQSISAGYQYRFGNSYWLGLSGAYGLQNYRVENNPIFNWDGVTPNLIKFGANLDYQPKESNWAFGFDINYSEESFVISELLDIRLQKVGMLGVAARGLYKFYDTEKYSSRINGRLELPISGSDDIEPTGLPGFILGADVTLKKIMKYQEVNLGVFLGLRNFENIQNSQSESVVGFEVKFRNKRWP
jgi:hypothetical protein